MSLVSSKQSKKHNLVDLLFVFFALTLILLVLAPSNGNVYNSVRTVPRTLDHTRVNATSGDASFTADQRYWDANCNRGWSSDARCDTIVARTQSCSISIASAYCSQYEHYLQDNK